MADYCTAEQVRVLLVDVSTDIMSNVDVNSFIDSAESIINSYVGVIYTVPFESGSIPPIIETICIDIAAFYVMRVLFTEDSQNTSEWTRDYYKQHINGKNGTLERIQQGLLSVILDDGTEAPSSSNNIESNTQDYNTTFDVDDPYDWGTDPDRLEEVAEERD